MPSLPFSSVPSLLRSDTEMSWTSISKVISEQQGQWLTDALQQHPQLAEELTRTLAGSRYFAEQLQRHFEDFQQLVNSGDLWRERPAEDFRQMVKPLLEGCVTEDQLNQSLRGRRRREMQRLIYRDFNRLATMEQTTAEISHFADTSIDLALRWHYQRLCEELGTPIGKHSGEAQQLVVIGMGKLGAFELNLSSDIDLVFAYPESGDTYPESGDTRGAPRSIDNHQFFLKLGQRLIKSLDTVTVDGFVFRVDMRLRPYGQSGVLALSFDAMEEYYQDQGRDWERYAMIKARVVAGDKERGEQLLRTLRPFVYRRYVDYSAIDSLREMKAMIHREVQRLGKSQDVKLGAGGIREVEFIAQTFQLIRGGRESELQERRVQRVLDCLAQLKYMPSTAVQELKDAYVFLRNTEHAIQGYQDKQTQALPQDQNGRARVAFVMGFSDWDAFSAALGAHRQKVQRHFAQLISDPEEKQSEHQRAGHQWIELWSGEYESDFALQQLLDAGFEQASQSWEKLCLLRESGQLKTLQAIGRTRLDLFMPQLLQAVQACEKPSLTLERVLPFVEAVVRRTSYLVLLMENPQALEQLVSLCQASPWIARQLARHPVLLDELLNTGTLYVAPEPQVLRQDLYLQMLRIPVDDVEAQMEGLRYFKLAHTLRVAASEVSGKLPLMKVSDYLTFIAEAVLEHVLAQAWQQLTARHGYPQRPDGQRCDPDFIVVGYGKLGGIELGYGSDLDLVFIHNAASTGYTDGDKSIDNTAFFTRLGQRIIHILNSQTTMGQLYEVDMRLRPSGASGLLVSSLSAFSEYQDNQAWAWEHQALVRARVVAGCKKLQKEFEVLREEVLCRQRDTQDLRQKVVEMRDKMADHLIPAKLKDPQCGLFHLKHSRGGIVDIEFMVQYAVLSWAHQYPALARWTDNIRILESLEEAGLFSAQEVADLIDAYKAFRSASHRLALQQQSSEVTLDSIASHRQAVLAKWQDLFS